jgi:signal transduction histidine kinase
VSTENGLNKFNGDTGTFTHYFVKDGLPTNNLSCVLEDESSMLWMSTSRGLSRFDPVASKFTNYSVVDGVPGNDLTGWDACFKSPSGEMFFGGFSGGVAFFPIKVTDRSDPPPLVLTDFRLAGHSVEVGAHSPLQKSISYANDVTLTHNQNIFSLTFAALTYFNPDANRYQYKLEGLEENWTEVGSDRRVVTYTTLPAGKYTFHVQSATRQGSWGEPGIALDITILPPWWSTWWFRLLTGVFILGLLGTLYQLRLRQLAGQFNMRLEARVAERTRIARDLHDTLLQSFQGVLLKFRAVTYIMRDRPDEAEETLNAVIDQAQQAVTEGRDAVQGLRSSTLAGNDLAGAIKLLGEELVADHDSNHCPDFRLYVEGTTRDLAPILRDETYRIVCEAMRNAFRHAQARRIEVGIRYGHRDLRLRVRDDGKGIDPNVLSVGARAGHFGLPGMHERVKVVGGKLAVWSKPDSGTEIELTIPGSLAYAKSPSTDH